jgi:hypothetical protein
MQIWMEFLLGRHEERNDTLVGALTQFFIR